MSGTRGEIDPSEFQPGDPIVKLLCFLVISIGVAVFAILKIDGFSTGKSVLLLILCCTLGIIGGFLGSSIGKLIQENVGAVAVYESSIWHVFMRKVSMKIGPGLVGCLSGAIAGVVLTITLLGVF